MEIHCLQEGSSQSLDPAAPQREFGSYSLKGTPAVTPGQAAALKALMVKLETLAPQWHIPHHSSSPCSPGVMGSVGLGEGITLLSPACP